MKRRSRFILWGSIALIVLACVGVYLYLFPFQGLEKIVIDTIEGESDDSSPFIVEIGNIGGSLLRDVVLDDVRISYRDSTGIRPLLSVKKVSAVYSISNIWNKQYRFDEVFLDSLVVTLERSPDGSFALPLPLGGSPPADSADTAAADQAPFEFAVDQLEINQSTVRILQLKGDTTVVSGISLQASVSGENGLYSADFKRLNFAAGPISGETRIIGKVSFTDGTLVVQDLQVVRGSTRIKISGAFNPDQESGSAHVAADHIDLDELADLTGVKLNGVLDLTGNVSYVRGRIGGQVTVGGTFLFAGIENLFLDFSFENNLLAIDTVYGTIFDDCSIDGHAEFDLQKPETYWLDADIREFDLSAMLPNTFPSDLTGHIRLDGRSFSNKDLVLDATVNLYESSFDDYPLHAASGRLRITTDSLTIPEPFEVVYFENHFFVQGSVDYSDNINLNVEADLPNLDRWRGKLFIDEPGGRATAEVSLTGSTSDPDLSGWLRSDSLWVYGLYTDSCFTEFSIDRFLTGRNGRVSVDLHGGEAWSLPYDTGRVDIGLDSLRVHLDRIHFVSPNVLLDVSGMFDQSGEPWALTADTLALSLFERQFYNRDDLVIAIDSLGFDLRNVSLGRNQTSIRAAGRVNYDETMNVRVDANDILIGSWLQLFAQDFPIDGYLSGTADLSGSFINPSFTADLAVDSLIYQSINLGDLDVSAQYNEERLTIDSMVILSSPGEYRASGYLYADLSLDGAAVERFPDRPFDVELHFSDSRFDLITALMPSIEQLNGDFSADVHLSGTPSDPHLEGQASLQNAELKYFDLANRIYADSAAVVMHDNQIILNEVTCYIRDKERRSYIYIDGDITVHTLDTLEYNLGISIPKQTPFDYQLADIQGKFRADLEVRGAPPKITGDVTVFSARDRSPFPSSREGSPLMLGLSGEDPWDLNINVDILSNYWIKNEDIDAEFSGFLNIMRERGQFRFAGEMEILRGRAFLFDKTFRIDPGSSVTFEDIDYPNPRLDITMRTRIPVAGFAEEQSSSEIELALHVTGTVENPEFNIADSEGDIQLTNEDILPLLVANYYGEESGGPGRFEARLTGLVSSSVSRIATRQLGVETFEIDPTSGGQLDWGSTQVTVGAYTNPNLYLYGRTSFQRVQEVGFEYRIKKGFLLEGRREEDEQAREHYGINLKLHWEF